METNRELLDSLRHCFSAAEWEWLTGHKGFQAVLPSVKTPDHVEFVAALGRKLYELAHPVKGAVGGKPPVRPQG